MRDPYTILSVISAIASLLSIIFDVPKKVSVSLKTFILLLSIVCALFFWGTSVGSDGLPDNNGESSDTLLSKDDHVVNNTGTDSPTNSFESNSLGSSAGTSVDVPIDNLSSTPVVSPISHNLLQIDPIIDSTERIASIKEASFDVSPIEILTLVGDVYEKGQTVDYEFEPQIDGRYRFEFSDVPDGTDLWLGIYNFGGEKISSSSNLDNGDGLTVSLKAGELYFLRVEQYNNFGHYVLNVGVKKPVTDISTFTAVSDSIQYTNQQNDYSFSASLDGRYRFEFSDVPDGTDLWLGIYNSGWEKIDSSSNLDNGDGLTVSLVAGKLYYLRVEQYNKVGLYTLNIGMKKPIMDISTFTAISDSIQYTDQQNDYSFSASLGGRYRFEFSDVPDGTDLWLGIYNSGWEKIDSSSNLDNGDGLTVDLSKNKEYFIRVSYYCNCDKYTLNVIRQND